MCGYINTVNVIDVNLHLCGWADIVNNHKTVSLRIFLVADLCYNPEDAGIKTALSA